MDDVKELALVLSTYKQLYLFHVSLIYSLVFVLYALLPLLSSSKSVAIVVLTPITLRNAAFKVFRCPAPFSSVSSVVPCLDSSPASSLWPLYVLL